MIGNCTDLNSKERERERGGEERERGGRKRERERGGERERERGGKREREGKETQRERIQW